MECAHRRQKVLASHVDEEEEEDEVELEPHPDDLV